MIFLPFLLRRRRRRLLFFLVDPPPAAFSFRALTILASLASSAARSLPHCASAFSALGRSTSAHCLSSASSFERSIAHLGKAFSAFGRSISAHCLSSASSFARSVAHCANAASALPRDFAAAARSAASCFRVLEHSSSFCFATFCLSWIAASFAFTSAQPKEWQTICI